MRSSQMQQDSYHHAASIEERGDRGGLLRRYTDYRPLVSQVPRSELEHNIHPNRLYNTSQHEVLGYVYNNRLGSKPPVRTSVVVARIPGGMSSGGSFPERGQHGGGDAVDQQRSMMPSQMGDPRQAHTQDRHHQSDPQQRAGLANDVVEAQAPRPQPYDHGDDRRDAPIAHGGGVGSQGPVSSDHQQPHLNGEIKGPTVVPPSAVSAAAPSVGPSVGPNMPSAPAPPLPPAAAPTPRDVTPIKKVQPPSELPLQGSHATLDRQGGLPPDTVSAVPQPADGAATLCPHRFSRPGDKFCAECGDSLDWFCAGSRGVVQQPIQHTTIRMLHSNPPFGPTMMASAPFVPIATIDDRYAPTDVPPLMTQSSPTRQTYPATYQSQLLAYNEHDSYAHHQLGGYAPLPQPPLPFRSVFHGQAPIISPPRRSAASHHCTCGSSLMTSACTCGEPLYA